MTEEDFRPFVELLGMVSEVYDRSKPTPSAARIYFRALEDLELSDIRGALGGHIKGARFMPRPADLRDLLVGSAEDRARGAWRKVVSAVERIGTWESVRFEDPAIHYALEQMGGWETLGVVEAKDLPFREKDFVAWYARGERAGLSWDQVPGHLSGRMERQNRAGGWELPPVRRAEPGAPAEEAPLPEAPRGNEVLPQASGGTSFRRGKALPAKSFLPPGR